MAQDNLILVTMNGIALAFNPITNQFFDYSQGNFSYPFVEEELILIPYDEIILWILWELRHRPRLLHLYPHITHIHKTVVLHDV